VLKLSKKNLYIYILKFFGRNYKNVEVTDYYFKIYLIFRRVKPSNIQ